jgi:hypothetical protein
MGDFFYKVCETGQSEGEKMIILKTCFLAFLVKTELEFIDELLDEVLASNSYAEYVKPAILMTDNPP